MAYFAELPMCSVSQMTILMQLMESLLQLTKWRAPLRARAAESAFLCCAEPDPTSIPADGKTPVDFSMHYTRPLVQLIAVTVFEC